VVGVDPAGTSNPTSDETGIVVVGTSRDGHYYVLDDSTGRYTPQAWGAKANACYDQFRADAIVPEKNYGGDMVRFTLENAGYSGARIQLVDSRRGKTIRAEPVVALYEQHKVHHVGRQGDLSELEDELTTWVVGDSSPNRLDALVHAVTALNRRAPAQVADPNRLRRPNLRVVS
jgi:phage terminase large subunit-like protein